MIRRGKKIFSLFAGLLEHPTDRTIIQASDAIAMLEVLNWEARQYLVEFRRFCQVHSLSALEEVYARTFGRDPACCPSVGHHLLVQDHSRTLFAARLRQGRLCRLAPEHEGRADHIAVMIRSLVVQDSVEEARELISRCLVPALSKMARLLKDAGNPYRDVLLAALLTLESADRQTIMPEPYAAGCRR